MNKVKWLELGGAPLRNDDWQFEADAVRDALKGLGSMLNENALLSGCVPTPQGGGYVFTEGYVLIDGEVFYVPAITVPITFNKTDNYFMKFEGVVNPDGQVVMENGNAVNIFKLRIAYLVYSAVPVPDSIGWNTAVANGLEQKTLTTVFNNSLKMQKGIYWNGANATLSIAAGLLIFVSTEYNFASVNTDNTELSNITGVSGVQPFLFTIKVAGSGYLKVANGTIKCPQERDHYFKVGDVILFMADGSMNPQNITLLSIGGSDSGWHSVTNFGAGVDSGSPLRYKKEGKNLIVDGAVAITNKVAFHGAGNIMFTLPVAPVQERKALVVSFDNSDTPNNNPNLCVFKTNGTCISQNDAKEAFYLTHCIIPLD